MAAGDPPLSRARRPQSVLFACTYNAIRSPMAEALARRLFGREIFFASAGMRAGEKDLFTTIVLQEIGIDISRRQPQSLGELDDLSFDLIVSLSPEAHHHALEFTRSVAVDVIYWPTFDPSRTQGSRETILEAYRDVRDGLEERIMQEFAKPIGGGV